MKKFLFAVVLVYFGYLGICRLNHNFSPANVHLARWPEIKSPSHHTPQEIAQVQAIVEQPFTYLGKGRQCFAFLSQDGVYVLKLLRCHRINETEFFDNFPLPHFFDHLRKDYIRERESRFNGLFISMNLAAHELKEQTGLLFAHIQPTRELHRKVTVTDRLGFTHLIDLDAIPFVIQRKAEKVLPLLQAKLAENDIVGLNRRLDQLIDLIVQRAKLGILDPDGRLLQNNNVGFVDDRAIYIDIGTFFRSYKSSDRAHLASDFRQLKPIVALLKAHDPEIAADFVRRENHAIQNTSLCRD